MQTRIRRRREGQTIDRQEQEGEKASVATSEFLSFSTAKRCRDKRVKRRHKIKVSEIKDARTALRSLAKATQLQTGSPWLHHSQQGLKTILNMKTVSNKISFDMKTRWAKVIIGLNTSKVNGLAKLVGFCRFLNRSCGTCPSASFIPV